MLWAYLIIGIIHTLSEVLPYPNVMIGIIYILTFITLQLIPLKKHHRM